LRIAIIASPFICVPPQKYGGTELFIAQLAEELKRLGLDVCVYTVGESTVDVETRWLYPKQEWPLTSDVFSEIKDLNHTSWALADCWNDADIVHLNNAPGLAFSRFGGPRFLYTLHHPVTPQLSQYYDYFPNVEFVTISNFQRSREKMEHLRTIHHGVDLSVFKFYPKKQDYLSFIGRIAPVKGTHLAIEVAKRSGMPLKIAGEVQPMYQGYFDTMVKPHIDGKFIEYIGEADLAAKNELLGNSKAMLFPIQWDEPFGLVMIEAMATGTPVLALPGGSVAEVVKDGVSGYICRDTDDMSVRVKDLKFAPQGIRAYVQQNFSVERMGREYAQLYATMLNAEKMPSRRVSVTTTLAELAIGEDRLSADDAENEPGNERAVA
jgi:glycosyltransferase involved in cell wall biosynthesis